VAGVYGGLGVSVTRKKLLVFVSSTFTDLIEERQAAVQAILKAGHIPAGMELFTAGDKSQLQTIYNWIDQSDVYMLILGGRYGSLENESKVSYTELEYDYASTQGKPIFSVVITEKYLDEKVSATGKSVLESENPKQLLQFREKVLTKTSSFFDDLKDVKLCIHECLGEYAMDPSLAGWVSGRDIVDSSSMLKELEELRAENAELRSNAEVAIVEGSTNAIDKKMSDLAGILEDIEVVVPTGLANNDTDVKMTLLSVLTGNKEQLVAGVTNQYGVGEVASFYYFNVFPKLQIHDLSDNEKVAGVKYRRSFVNREGQKFLAWYERKLINSKKNSDAGKL
jgi:hypothetical protein